MDKSGLESIYAGLGLEMNGLGLGLGLRLALFGLGLRPGPYWTCYTAHSWKIVSLLIISETQKSDCKGHYFITHYTGVLQCLFTQVTGYFYLFCYFLHIVVLFL